MEEHVKYMQNPCKLNVTHYWVVHIIFTCMLHLFHICVTSMLHLFYILFTFLGPKAPKGPRVLGGLGAKIVNKM